MIKDCLGCHYENMEIYKDPCRECFSDGNGYPHFKPKELNYSSCRDNHLTPGGGCDVYRDATPCLQWDCHLWSNEPAKDKGYTKPSGALV